MLLDGQRNVVRLEQGEDADISGRVAEPRDRSLQKGGTEAAVEPPDSSLMPQGPEIQ